MRPVAAARAVMSYSRARVVMGEGWSQFECESSKNLSATQSNYRRSAMSGFGKPRPISSATAASELTDGRVVLASYAEPQPCVTPVIGVIVSRYPSRSSSLTSIVIPPINSRGL